MTNPSLATEVRALFEEYSEAFASFDGKQVAMLYYIPTITMRGDGSIHCLRSDKELAVFFQGVIDTYRRDGYIGSNIKNFEVLPIGDLSALATMDWEMLRQDKSLIRRWRQSYNVVRTPAGWRILVATFHVAQAAA
jgi:hypothetical protein